MRSKNNVCEFHNQLIWEKKKHSLFNQSISKLAIEFTRSIMLLFIYKANKMWDGFCFACLLFGKHCLQIRKYTYLFKCSIKTPSFLWFCVSFLRITHTEREKKWIKSRSSAAHRYSCLLEYSRWSSKLF